MENKFIRADEVAQELDVSKPRAYKLIRQLNDELKAKGYRGISGITRRTGGTEQSCSPVGTSQTGILLPQVHGA